jgi:prepilin-type N-terminal cleavage/methylation domain-containing protein
MNPKTKIQTIPAFHFSPSTTRAARGTAFTLVELLVVISIIGLLAGLGVPAINGALKAAKKSEVAALTQSIRTALIAWNSEYGTWPTQNLSGGTTGFETTKDFYNRMATTNDSTNNPRAIIFLEVPVKFLDGQSNIVTPSGFIRGGSRPMIRFQVDGSGSGSISNVGYENTNLRTAAAVWAPDSADPTKKSVGTWK